jgi:hypothetical protein
VINSIRQYLPGAENTDVPIETDFDTDDVDSLLRIGFVDVWRKHLGFKEFQISADGTELRVLISCEEIPGANFLVGTLAKRILPGGTLVMPQIKAPPVELQNQGLQQSEKERRIREVIARNQPQIAKVRQALADMKKKQSSFDE